MVPLPSVRSLFSRSRGETHSKVDSRPKIRLDRRTVTDDDILASIDEIYIQAKELLAKEKIDLCVDTFLFLTEYDILFKKIISSQLTNVKGDYYWPDGLVLTEEVMSFLIMIQSFFNSFRINLLMDVVDSLYDKYRETMNQMKVNYQMSLQKFNSTNNSMKRIINKLKSWYRPHKGDYFFDLLYEESNESFLELKLHAAKQLQKLINTQLHMLG